MGLVQGSEAPQQGDQPADANGDAQQPSEAEQQSIQAARQAEKARREAKAGSGKGQQPQASQQVNPQQQACCSLLVSTAPVTVSVMSL